MTLSENDLDHLIEVALKVATRASDHIQRRSKDAVESQKKVAGSSVASQVVTEVDHEAQAIILEGLQSVTKQYGLGLLAEESEDNGSRFECDYFWAIDPLDGTLAFVEGLPGYSVSIGLVTRQGQSVLGVVRCPVDGETFHARKGSGVFRNGETLSTGASAKGGPLRWMTDRSMTMSKHFPDLAAFVDGMAERLGYEGVERIDFGGGALYGCWVGAREPGIYFKLPKSREGGGAIWDFAASSCVLAEWGRPVLDMKGKPLSLNQSGSLYLHGSGVLYTSDEALEKALLDGYAQGLLLGD